MQHGRTPVQFDPELGSGAGDSDEGPSLTPSSAHATVWTPSDSSHELAAQDDYRVSDEDFREHLAVLSSRPRPITVVGPRMDSERQRKVYERLALYRIRASKMAQGVPMDELDDMTLRKEYPPEALEEAYYFSDYDHEGTIDWYFDPDLSVHSCVSDYHRLVLKNGDGTRYLDWEKYCSWFTTYETDEEYLKYFEELSKKIKWIKRYMKFERGSPEWIEMEARGFRQAVEIAVDFPHMNSDLAFTAYTEHISNMRFDYFDLEEIDPLLFDIWKRVTKQKITFRQALDQIQKENMFPRHEKCIQFFDTCVEDISDETPEDEGRRLITMAVWNKLHKEKSWNEYIMRKIEIAKHIGLDLQIKRYMKFERGSPEWIEMEARGFRQAVEIAVDFPHMNSDLAFTAYTEHISNMRFDYFDLEEIDPLLFDIWKRVTKQKFDTCVEDISDETPEDEGRRLITMAVWNKLHKEKSWNEYIMRKIEIAKHIGLDLQATCIRI